MSESSHLGFSARGRLPSPARRCVDPGGVDTSLDNVRDALDADPIFERTVILRATTQELGSTREGVLEAVVQRLDLSQKHAAEAYTLAKE